MVISANLRAVALMLVYISEIVCTQRYPRFPPRRYHFCCREGINSEVQTICGHHLFAVAGGEKRFLTIKMGSRNMIDESGVEYELVHPYGCGYATKKAQEMAATRTDWLTDDVNLGSLLQQVFPKVTELIACELLGCRFLQPIVDWCWFACPSMNNHQP